MHIWHYRFCNLPQTLFTDWLQSENKALWKLGLDEIPPSFLVDSKKKHTPKTGLSAGKTWEFSNTATLISHSLYWKSNLEKVGDQAIKFTPSAEKSLSCPDCIKWRQFSSQETVICDLGILILTPSFHQKKNILYDIISDIRLVGHFQGNCKLSVRLPLHDFLLLLFFFTVLFHFNWKWHWYQAK